MNERQIRVFRSAEFVRSRATTYPVPYRRSVHLIARGTGTVMYKSKACSTVEEAQALATRHLERNPHLIDTTEGVLPKKDLGDLPRWVR